MTRFRTLLAALVIGQFAWCGSAVAQTQPACSPSSGTVAGTNPAEYCQYHFIKSPAVGNTAAVDESGTAFATGLSTAPALSVSAGVRQDAGVGYILYNNYANGCRFISNNNSSTATDTGDLFVPQATLPEFSKFVANAPNISVSYCAQSITYTPKSAYAPSTSGVTTPFVLWSATAGATGTPVAGTPPLTSPVITVPTTSVTVQPGNTLNTYTPPIIGTQSGNQYNFQYSYTRSDCILQPGAAYLCNPPIPIVENQLVSFTTATNASPDCTLGDVRTIGGGNEDGLNPSHTLDCDGSWPTVAGLANPTILYSCSVNGGPFSMPVANPSACASNFTPPGTPQAVVDYPGALVLVLDESGSVPEASFEAAQVFFESLTSPTTGLNFTNTATVATILFNSTPPRTRGGNFTLETSDDYGVQYLSSVYNPVTNNAGLQTMLKGLTDQSGGTDVYTAVQTALTLITGSTMPSTPKTIVLASDGQHDALGMFPASIGNTAVQVNNRATLAEEQSNKTVLETIDAFTALGKTIAADGVRIIAVGINDGSYCNTDSNNPAVTAPSTCNSYYNSGGATYPPGIYVENALTAAETGGTAGNTFLASSYATLLTDVGAGLEQTITLDAGTVCVPSTLDNGTIAAAPACTITCNAGYTLSNMTCVAN